MKTRIWSRSPVLMMVLVACDGPGPADPVADDPNIDAWDGTPWPALFREARELGGRARIVPSEGDSEYRILPVESRPRHVWIDPACSVPGNPDVGEARAFRNCMDKLGRETELTIPPFGRDYAFWLRPDRLLTWEEAAGAWRVWHHLKFTCGEGFDAAQGDGVLRER